METIIIETVCPFCGSVNRVTVFVADYLAWEEGALIQEAFPYLSADERELLKTGICSDCWVKMFLA